MPCQSSRWSLVPPGGSQGVVAAATVLASLIAQACFYSPIYGEIDETTRNSNSDTTQSIEETLATGTSTAEPTTEPPSVCGDGLVESAEECDDGDQDDGDSCTNACTLARCGDGIPGLGEACDDGNTDPADGCNNLCRLPNCGDGLVDADEMCDDGNADNDDACTTLCKPPTCGDGLVSVGEECDDGDADDTNACVVGCKSAQCGDGFLGPGEACDDGNANDLDECSNSCSLPGCGDGVQAGAEECDDGNATNEDACTNACKLPVCGDGVLTPDIGEACDDGDQDNTNACLASCELAACGDGFIHVGSEECDDGNAQNTDGCVSACVPAKCGDGFVYAGVEECDDANADNSDPCLDNCKLSACGAIDPNTCPGNSKSELFEKNVSIAINNLGDKWDDKYNGTIASMLCNDIIVPASSLQLIGGMSLKVGMDHMYVGDLTIKIVSPDNKIFTPLSRPGPEAPLMDNGVPCCGENSNLSAVFPFTLTDSAVVSAKDMGKTLLNDAIICKDENPKIEPCEFKPYPGLAPGKAFSDYKGDAAPGTWKVCIGDSGSGDFGLLKYIGLTINRVKYAPK